MNAAETKPLAASQAGSCCAPEQTRTKRTFMPRADIYETKDSVVVIADMPGVDETSVDITLEKNVLTLRGAVETAEPEGFKSAHREYDEGSYERAFTLSDAVDREGIQASVKDGVLRVTLRKAGPTQPRKIDVKAS